MRVGLGVHGRFHAFALANALETLGHEVTVFTNYPDWACERFGVRAARVRSFLPHAFLSRAARLALGSRQPDWYERIEHETFGKWLAEEVVGEGFDVLHTFSGVAEEAFEALREARTLRSLIRGSAHISTQARILEEEERRVGRPIGRPGKWIVGRERREYDLADRIVVLSRFAERSFIAEGRNAEKVVRVPLGVNVSSFAPRTSERMARTQRLREGRPLRLLYVGSLSFRKGLLDLAEIRKALPEGRFEWRLVGETSPEAKVFFEASGLRPVTRGRVPEQELRQQYAWGDIFLLPTVEDGFAAVLAQAAAAGLPFVATENSGAAEVTESGASGWVVPIRRPDLFVERLLWCDENRSAVAEMSEKEGFSASGTRTWVDAATDIVGAWRHWLDEHGGRREVRPCP